MEVRRTVRVKLDVPDERLADLHATIKQFNNAANYTVEHGTRLLPVPEGKRLSGLGDGQLAPKSGTMNGNGIYTPSDVESADRESTGKPTTSVVGR